MKVFILVLFAWYGDGRSMSLDHIQPFKIYEECETAGKAIITMQLESGKSITFRCVTNNKL